MLDFSRVRLGRL